MLKAIGYGMIETTLIYLACGLFAVYLFGSNTQSNVLDNIDG